MKTLLTPCNMSDEELSAEEIVALKARAAQADNLEKEHADTVAKLKELEDDDNAKDWRKARKRMEAMEAALKKQGKIVDPETHEVKTEEQKFSPEDVDIRAEAAAERVLVKRSLEKVKRDLSEEDQKIFGRFYEKATHNETVTSDNVEEFIDLAFKLGGAGAQSKTLAERGAGGRGGAPRMEKASEDYSETAEGKKILEKMGLPSEAKK